jgi:hypothetical protein
MSTFTPSGFSNNGMSIGGVPYTLTYFGYTPPPVNSTPPGNIVVTISTTTVPEPASMVMFGSGLFGALGLGLRRMRRA